MVVKTEDNKVVIVIGNKDTRASGRTLEAHKKAEVSEEDAMTLVGLGDAKYFEEDAKVEAEETDSEEGTDNEPSNEGSEVKIDSEESQEDKAEVEEVSSTPAGSPIETNITPEGGKKASKKSSKKKKK